MLGRHCVWSMCIHTNVVSGARVSQVQQSCRGTTKAWKVDGACRMVHVCVCVCVRVVAGLACAEHHCVSDHGCHCHRMLLPPREWCWSSQATRTLRLCFGGPRRDWSLARTVRRFATASTCSNFLCRLFVQLEGAHVRCWVLRDALKLVGGDDATMLDWLHMARGRIGGMY